MKYGFDLTFTSEMSEFKNTMNQIGIFFSQECQKFTPEDLFELKLIFDELLCNAVIHGNKLDKTKNVTVTIRVDADMIYGKILDEGCGFPNCNSIPNCDDTDSEHGRGVKIVAALTKKLTFLGEGNEVEFYKKVTLNG